MTLRVAILGSTGSIGRSTLEVVDAHPEALRVVALAAGRNASLLRQQTEAYAPSLISLDDAAGYGAWRPQRVETVAGPDGLLAAAMHPDADIVVVATTGHAAIVPTLAALRAGKKVALANKETIVCAGEFVTREVPRAGDRLRPVDSEHSALWQCLEAAHARAEPERLILTASGGPFRTASAEALRTMTAADALKHPTWDMGSKVTIDSATLMNKGLEMIEARWLFDMPYDRIDVIVNPQSILHSYIAFEDGSLIGQLGPADMRLPIQYALSYPERWLNPFRRADLAAIGRLDFETTDIARFPALRLARAAGLAGNTYPTVLSAADEVAVALFLRGQIGFLDIPALVERALEAHEPDGPLSLESIAAADRWARAFVSRVSASG